MKTTSLVRLSIALLLGAVSIHAADQADKSAMPQPAPEHAWLQQFVGDWDSTVEIMMDPSQPPAKGTGQESVRSLGGFWIISEGRGEMPGCGTMQHVLTLGYDEGKKKYVGTWVDSMMNHLWTYEGSVDSTGKILTLESQGPDFAKPGSMAKYRDQTEFKSKDHRIFTSSVQGPDGKWVVIMKGEAHRKK